MSDNKEQNEALNEDQVTNEQTGAEDVAGNTAENTDNSTEAKPATPEEQMAVLNDKYLRLYSEFDNYRKRTNKEKIDLIATASAGVLKDMLSVLDDFERAIVNNEKVEDINAVREGFQLIYNKLKSGLEAKGLKQMQAKGEVFDSELHEAIANVPAPDAKLKGKVVDDVERGYYLNDKVIRFAKVVVGQ